MLQVGADADFRHSDGRVSKLGITKLVATEDPREHVADFLRNAQLPLGRTRFALLQPGTISVSKHSITSPSWRSWKLAKDRPHS